jgi:hypothetical protein
VGRNDRRIITIVINMVSNYLADIRHGS